jgi:hypothetical protein
MSTLPVFSEAAASTSEGGLGFSSSPNAKIDEPNDHSDRADHQSHANFVRRKHSLLQVGDGASRYCNFSAY